MKRALILLAIVMAAATRSTSAHHSYSAYDLTRLVSIEGVIEEFEWVAPHSLLKVKDADGHLYVFEWRAPFGMERAGIQRETLKKGDRILVAGNPHRDFEENRILNFKKVQRLSDGWQWPNW